jgi:hypothetical protein
MHRGSTILIVVLSALLGAGVARVSAVEQGWVWAITISLLGIASMCWWENSND